MAILKAIFEEQGHVYRHPETKAVVPSVTQILAANGLVNYNGVRKSVLEHKADLGTEVHFCCALVDKGEDLADYQIDERVLPYVDAYMEFKRLMKWQPFIVQPEPMIAEVCGMLCGFQPDAVGMVDGAETILELKTISVVGPALQIQLAGYDSCMGSPRRKRMAVQLLPDEKFKIHEFNDSSDYGVFQAALALTWFRLNKGLLDAII